MSNSNPQYNPLQGQTSTTYPPTVFAGPHPSGGANPGYNPYSSQTPVSPLPDPQAAFHPPVQRKKSPVVLIGILVVVIVAGLGVGGYFVIRAKSGSASTLYQSSLTSPSQDWNCQTQCAFQSDGYHIMAGSDNLFYFSLLAQKTFDQVVIDVKGTVIKDVGDGTGMAIDFCTPTNAQLAGYGFEVFTSSAGNVGAYMVVRWDTQGNPTKLINPSPSSLIHTGVGQTNDLKVVVNKSTFTFFINGTQVNQMSDSTYPSGEVGLGTGGPSAEMAFTDLLLTTP